MKVGTDAVLLAAWVNFGKATRVLDIGTGSGVIALIAAQRTPDHCVIDGVEIQDADCEQAASNAAHSPWSSRINIIHTDIQHFQPVSPYDVILCNPPYFINRLLPLGSGRTTARFIVTLDHTMLVAAMDRLLSPEGTANLVMPPDEGTRLMRSMQDAGLQTTRLCHFKTRPGNRTERLLMTFARARRKLYTIEERFDDHSLSPVMEESEIQLYEEGDSWTKQYRDLTQELYLPRP